MVGQARRERSLRRARLGVAGQLRVVLGASILVLGAILAVAFYVPYELNRMSDQRYVEDVIPLNRTAHELVSDVAAGEAAAAEHGLTGDPSAHARYLNAFDAASRTLTTLQARAAEHPPLATLVRRATDQIAQLQGTVEARLRQGSVPIGEAETDLARVGEEFDRVRQTTDRMVLVTDELVVRAQRDQRDTYRQLLLSLGWLGALGLAIGGALFVVTPRRLGELYAGEQRARREAESRADAARALAHVSDGVVLTGNDGGLRFWNPAAAALLDLRDGDAAGRRLPELVPGWRTTATTSTNGGAQGPLVVPLTTRAGERWLSVTSVDFGDGVVYAIRDVTEERALETMRSDFLATASHELRTPMTSIYGAARTLLARDDELTAERRVAFLEMIASESERLARIIDGILLASRLDAGEVDLSTEQCDVVAICRSVLATAEIRAPENVSLQLDAPSSLPTASCDPNRLRQVLLNLVDNAIKYSPQGGDVVLSVALSDPGTLLFTVRDQGLGFPPDEAQRIFERFYRVDPGLRQGIGGTGLGLYISRELVERMHGRIRGDSEPGRGSAFSVELPLAGDAQRHLPGGE